MPDPRRLKRLESLLHETLAPLLARGLADPRLHFVTLTRVRLAPDLSIARVNWSCLGDEADRSKAAHALERARGHLQKEVAAALQTRTTPRLQFHYDEAGEKAARVNEILEEIRRSSEGASDGASTPPRPPASSDEEE